jgi:hypothetical protein
VGEVLVVAHRRSRDALREVIIEGVLEWLLYMREPERDDYFTVEDGVALAWSLYREGQPA